MPRDMENLKPPHTPPQWQRILLYALLSFVLLSLFSPFRDRGTVSIFYSEKLGPVTFRRGEQPPFLGRENSEPKDFSEKTAQLIDEEIRFIIGEMEEKAIKTLSEDREELDVLARELFRRETLTEDEIEEILDLPEEQNREKKASN